MMSLKLTIKVVAFFLGHPVYTGLSPDVEQVQWTSVNFRELYMRACHYEKRKKIVVQIDTL